MPRTEGYKSYSITSLPVNCISVQLRCCINLSNDKILAIKRFKIRVTSKVLNLHLNGSPRNLGTSSAGNGIFSTKINYDFNLLLCQIYTVLCMISNYFDSQLLSHMTSMLLRILDRLKTKHIIVKYFRLFEYL